MLPLSPLPPDSAHFPAKGFPNALTPTTTVLRLLLLLPLLLAFSLVVSAQQSAKVKSKDRFREKDPTNNPVRLRVASQLNSPEDDMAPAWYRNGIVFVSNRGKNGIRGRDGELLSDLYFSPFDPNGDPAPPEFFSIKLNSELNEGPITFSRDWKYAYFSRNSKKKSKKGRYEFKIYQAKDDYPDWSDIKELSFCSDEFSCIHPTLSFDGNRMYFSSDMPGGEGGFDIWYVEKVGRNWSDPINAGPEINTDKHELSPFINQNNTLYFVSGGHNTLGGLDIFYVNDPLSHTGEIVNLGEPFNSTADDMGLVIDLENKNGFFSSKRNDGKHYDIFRFESPRRLEGTTKPVANRAEIIVTDARTGQPLQGVSIRILQPSEDGFVNSKEEMYSIDLLPVQDRPNALSLQLVRKDAKDLGAPDLMTNVDGRAPTEFIEYKNYLVLVSLNGYRMSERFFPGESIRDGQLRFALDEAPLCLKASGLVQTSEFYTRIANASLRFVHKSSGHEERVRTNLNGQFDACLPQDGDYAVYVHRDGFKDESFSITATRGRDLPPRDITLMPTLVGGAAATVEATLPLATGLHEGSVLIMDRVFYEYHKATLNQGAVRYFDALYDLLQRYPEMEIDLIAHTDTRGEASENLSLTSERAKNARTYLEWRGIAKGRINAIGKGETEPRNRCTEGVECSDEEHQQNNRIEIKVRKLGNAVKP